MWAGQPDPAETRIELAAQADREATALRQLLAGWSEIDPAGTGKTVAELMRALAEQPNEYDTIRGVLWELTPPRDGKTFNPRSVGMKFHHLRNRVIGGRYLTSRPARMGVIWCVECGSRGTSGTSSPYVREKQNSSDVKNKKVQRLELVPLAPLVPQTVPTLTWKRRLPTTAMSIGRAGRAALISGVGKQR